MRGITSLVVAESHLTRRVFEATLGRIVVLSVPTRTGWPAGKQTGLAERTLHLRERDFDPAQESSDHFSLRRRRCKEKGTGGSRSGLSWLA